MKAVILAGGLGTRLSEETVVRPKPMVEIGGKPILWHIMKHFAHHGCDEFFVALGYMGDFIKSYFLDRYNLSGNLTIDFGRGMVQRAAQDSEDWKVNLIETGLHSMTGGRLRRLRDWLDGETFMLTYGDGVSDVPIDKLVAFHQSHDASMTLTAVRPPSRFGEVAVDGRGFATSFNEKPQTSAGLISGGYFACRASLFDYLDDREDLVLEAEPMRKLVRDRRLAAYTHEGFWQCMDTYRDWELLNELDRKNEAPWRH